MTTPFEFQSLFDKANRAGYAAAEATTPTPMVVAETQPGGQRWHVPDGPCGFAWVVVKPGTARFAKWLKKEGHASTHYYGGLSIWIGAHNQSMERKAVHARVLAEALNGQFGVSAYADSRMD